MAKVGQSEIVTVAMPTSYKTALSGLADRHFRGNVSAAVRWLVARELDLPLARVATGQNLRGEGELDVAIGEPPAKTTRRRSYKRSPTRQHKHSLP